jgi:hypothetical protein
MEPRWQKVYSSNDQFKVELLKQVLVANQIEAVVLNQKDSSYQFGEVSILVPEADRFTAETLIHQQLNNS